MTPTYSPTHLTKVLVARSLELLPNTLDDTPWLRQRSSPHRICPLLSRLRARHGLLICSVAQLC